ncbi:MAG: F-type H+/Na+-transporting ATPase subunit alpha [Mycobacterium sp.]|jgi:F-type H+-transporting ATPase subunit alpha|nr:F-type H+/Na+-transporting ATPase subunit alpha [Mycobacterium sp.]
MAELTISADDIQSAIEEYVESFTSDTSREEVGTVVDAGDGIAHVEGLPSVMMQELLEFTGGVLGVALNLDEHNIGAVVLGDFQKIEEGQQVKRTGEVLSVPVGDGYLGRVVDPLGHPIDGGGDIETDARRVLELQAPSVIDRQGVKEPLQTGIKAIDAMTPIGRGQRQLIIGDRKTGKTAVCVDTILNQRKNWETDDEKKQVRCVYVAVGQKGTTIAAVRQALEEGGAMDYTTIVAAPASDSAGFKWLAPYTGSAIAQHWMYAGKHVLIVFDDLTKHADAYRAISLLLRRPPGREAFPGDVFYLHSRLLERCAKLSDDLGGGSLTALPVIETKANDISAYIPTNVISITDGQCFLESDLFNQGVRPAINVGSSVSRVGGAAQIKAMKEVSGSLRLDLSQYRELESFAAFASDLDDTSKKQLARGERLVELLKQPQYRPMAIEEQVVSIFLGTGGHLDSVPVEDVKRFEAELLDHMKASEEGFLENIRKSEKLGEEDEEKLVDIIDHFKKGFSASGGGSVVPDSHVEAMDEDEVAKESVQVKKEKPKDKDSKKDSKKDSGESTKASGDSKKESKDTKKDKK